ncbi:Myc-type basic helix-loop-helix (bHLH) domain-containing protein [Dioscorea alata]|uniref:Myc-type basic helix-loop-helix (BHLH) domain-containing protein n=1 Tax=Dioscorea alata TaxID=55571 RepID=A0ACB7U4D4_DIOAL|nr:Myc-type basic helix-loop-helix (bHLH) domain-containing protein [Dioscorea alata]
MVASLHSVLLVLDSSEVVRHNALKKMKMKMKMKKKKMVRINMKMRRRSSTSREPLSLIEKRLRALKKLLPASDAGSVFDLFRQTSEYIACLQAQIKLMRFMVQVLSQNSDN